ncbi:DUF6541 family protein [Pseudarthrobacter oxydans]|uniref:DUF6541 family protein n=1 Tax=Pseudarthrobacter oxydans TaxID=1671 RepID=UPI00344E6BC3
MSWFSTVPAILACLALLFIPGLFIVAALGLQRLWYLAVAPVLTISVVAVTAIAAPLAGVSWGPLPVIVATALISGALFVMRMVLERRGKSGMNLVPHWTFRTPTKATAIAAAGFLAGSSSIAFQLYKAFDRPENISQTFDNVFHLNAIRYVLDTGNASSLSLSSMTSGDSPPYFYPAAWHGLASLLVQVTGSPISVAVNVLNLCIAATVWTAGCMFLARTAIGPNAYAVAAAGVLSAGFSSFPLLLLDFGVLYPNFLAISMLPAALATVAIFFGISDRTDHPVLARYVLAPMAATGIAIAHPNGLMSLLAVSIPILLVSFLRFFLLRYRSNNGHGRTAVMGVGLLGILGVIVVMWNYIRPPAAAATWLPFQTPGQAIGEVITNSAMQRPPAFAVSILLITGVVVMFRRHQRIWLLGSFIVVAVLFVVVSAGAAGQDRDALTGVWYNDSYRLAALLPVAAVPLAAAGVGWLAGKLQHLWVERRSSLTFLPPRFTDSRLVVPVLVPLALLGVLMVLQTLPLRASIASARANYVTTADSALVSADEMALIEELDAIVPPEATIAVNPWTGGAMAFALADRNTTSKHTLTTYTKSVELLNDKFREASTDPEVCSAAAADNVRYVLDFGTREVHGGNHGFAGLHIPDKTPGFTLRAQRGEAKLYEVTACP